MEIERLSKDKVMRPSLIDSVDKINEIIDGVNLFDPTEIDAIESRVDALETNGISTRTTTGEADGALISVTAKGHAEQDGTPTPSDPKEIRVVRGRNLAKSYKVESSANPYSAVLRIELDLEPNTTYTLSFIGASGNIVYLNENLFNYSSITCNGSRQSIVATTKSEIPSSQHNADGWLFLKNSGSNTVAASFSDIQLELGSTAHPYVPYGHVGLDVTADGTTTTTPIPLPSRGWVGSLPDGTHDALAIDGAGKVTWELADAMTDSAATEGVTGTVGVDVLSTTGEIADGATVLYKTTPTTESMGYVDLPDIPEGAVVSIPELEGLGVESWNNDIIYRYVKALVTRAVQ